MRVQGAKYFALPLTVDPLRGTTNKMTTRRCFLQTVAGASVVPLFYGLLHAQITARSRPNILCLVSEDNSPFLGCYGDAYADTPNLDRFAQEGILYQNAFANAPVCSPARSTVITGMYACSLGTHHMRSRNPLPDSIGFFTQYLRAAGYYCTNKAKEDYNTIKPDGVWDESGQEASWLNRSPEQPFFSVVNFSVTHESSLHNHEPTQHDPAMVYLPPYHPDTWEFRQAWAQYYDKITEFDRQFGQALADLEMQGLADETIVFYYSDHGGVLPRSKRFLYDSGTRVPLIVRLPKKYQALAPVSPGSQVDRLVSFVDFAPTMLSLAGISIPSHFQGQAFLGSQMTSEPDYVYLFRGRMDERYDMMRGVRDKRFKYIRNYMSHRIYAQHLVYLWRMSATQSWQDLYDRDELNPVQRQFFQPKPIEELYDTHTDPHEIHNLALNPEYQDILQQMRTANRLWILRIRDPGFLPEAEMVLRSEGSSPFEMAQSLDYDLPRIMDAAEWVNHQERAVIPILMTLLLDNDSGVRYWAAEGCVALGAHGPLMQTLLKTLLEDPSPSVRIAAAEALCHSGQLELAFPALRRALGHPNEFVRLHAINVIDYLDDDAHSFLSVLEQSLNDESPYVQRVAQKALADFT